MLSTCLTHKNNSSEAPGSRNQPLKRMELHEYVESEKGEKMIQVRK